MCIRDSSHHVCRLITCTLAPLPTWRSHHAPSHHAPSHHAPSHHAPSHHAPRYSSAKLMGGELGMTKAFYAMFLASLLAILL
eukprot:5672623-Prymnesium_polylepis.1